MTPTNRRAVEDWETTAARLRRTLSARYAGERLDHEMQRLEEGYWRARAVHEEWAAAKQERGADIEQIVPILERIDPARITKLPGYDPSLPSYDEEAALIAWHLDEAKTCDDLARIVGESFTRVWAPHKVQSPRALDGYAQIAREIWAMRAAAGKEERP